MDNNTYVLLEVFDYICNKYEAEKEALAELIKLRNELRKDELMAAVIKSEHSYEEIMAFIKGSTEREEE
ncbi:hypothetical protein SAMN04487770_1317 [Butyrivibrio sp. ob235]|uniref:hypothetical protein n=1 Tax=Butyrivibrio sp. ob235 TaxID=1761780 RepID=UPI0008B7C1F7|nr:hypothetical protein [Butyrivibrio sp. ob235]SEM25897.1 hypothetical protein SAMN04487770_1317 [Butyrivibrio sp. ob235]